MSRVALAKQAFEALEQMRSGTLPQAARRVSHPLRLIERESLDVPYALKERGLFYPGRSGLACVAMRDHNRLMKCIAMLAVGALMVAGRAFAQAAPPETQQDSSKISADGTAIVTRVVPVPATVSPEAQKFLARPVSDAAGPPQTVEQDRAGVDRWQAGAGEVSKKLYPVEVSAATIAGIPVRVVTPLVIAAAKRDRVLMNLHGGGFRVDSGSLTETVPIANLTGTKVVSVLYRMAPEHAFPAAVDDAIAVYRELLKSYKASHIGIYGTSAGAILTAEVTARIKQLSLPMPAVTGVFSGMGDMSRNGDSVAMYGLNGLSGHLDPPKALSAGVNEYAGSADLTDPVLSPIYSDLRGFPPTLFLTSGRDLLLSGTVNLHRAYRNAGVKAELVVFDALPHAFWNEPLLPESKEANQMMATFLDSHLGK